MDLVGALGADPDHLEWGQVLDFASALEEFPARTFAILPAMAKEPPALAMLLLQAAAYRKKTFSALWDTFKALPGMWHLVKLDDLLDAGRRLMESFEKTDASLPPELKGLSSTDPKNRMRGIVRMLRQQAPLRAPFLNLLADALSMESDLDLPEVMTRFVTLRRPEALDKRLDELRNRLRIRHSRLEPCDWPNKGRLDLVIGSSELPKSEVPWIEAKVPHASEVVNAPMVAAAIQASEVGKEPSERAVGALKYLRAFDPIWFDEAHAIGLAKLINTSLERRVAQLS